MNGELHLIGDGSGLAVLGAQPDVERFLSAEGLPSRDLGLGRMRAAANLGSTLLQESALVAQESGRWVKLTKESAQQVRKYGLRESSASGLSTGVLKGEKGRIKGFVEIAQSPRSLLRNPATLASAGRLLAQVALQSAMDEVTDYLATIDKKVDEVLRGQRDAALAAMIGVGLVVDEVMIIREHRVRVDEVLWSKVAGAPATIADTQAYALLKLDGLATRMESCGKVGDLASAAEDAEVGVRGWTAVLARCVQLQDAVAVLELDRVMDYAPDELNEHRLGLRSARESRLEVILSNTERLMGRMNAAAGAANAKVLLHPHRSPAVVGSVNRVVGDIHEFRNRIGLDAEREAAEARRWVEAATDVRDRALESGAKGVVAARGFGTEALGRAGSVTGRLSSGVTARARRLRRGGEKPDSAD